MNKISFFRGFGFACALFFLFVARAAAQNPSSYYVEVPRTFYGGVLLGGNFTQVDGDAFAGYHKVGINVGGIMYMRLADHLAMSMELLYSQKGSRKAKNQVIPNSIYDIGDYKIKLDYVEIPIQLNYFDRRKSHFGAGFSYAQLVVPGKESVTSSPAISQDTLDQYKFKKGDVNFILGGNLHLVKGLFLNLRFQYSLLSVRKDHYPGLGRASQYNNQWTLRLMYLF